MPRVHNISDDDLDCPGLGLAVSAGATVDVTDEQAEALAPTLGGVTYEHPYLKVVADAPAADAKPAKTPASKE